MVCFFFTVISVGYTLNHFLKYKKVSPKIINWLIVILTFAIVYGVLHMLELAETMPQY